MLPPKRGVFKPLKPIKILCVKYETNGFMPFLCDIGDEIYLILLFCNYSTKAVIYEFNGLYDPKYLNLNPKDENSW